VTRGGPIVYGSAFMAASNPLSNPLLADLREAYLDEDLILFAGAGLSAAAGLPSWRRLVELLVERATARGVAAPLLHEIADLLARERLIDALSAVKAALGPNDFGAAVEKLLDDKALEAPAVAASIASLAPRLRGVLTTNLDHLLEKAFKGAWPALAKVTGDVVRRRHYILKLHGTLIDRETWVFTRDEYDRAMYADPKLQTAFTALFHSCPILFVGYGLSDDDFDQVLSRVRVFAGAQPPRHFALMAEETMTPHRKAQIEAGGVQIIPYANPDGRHGEVVRILDWLAGS
jgi:SIR2-like protein